MIVRKLRLKRGWSQEHLAQLTGLNVRTIQRIERGQTPSLESRKSLAAIFEVDIATFAPESAQKIEFKQTNQRAVSLSAGDAKMNEQENTTTETISTEEKHAIEYAKGVKEFLTHLLMFLIFVPFILFKNGTDDFNLWLVILCWAAALIVHGLNAFEKINFFKVDWERKIAEKKLGRKL
ncbi:MAG: helix-turn-helix domain-containing protein [Kangiellaceae bacterium]|nr:helix-turn-helix domain-containing protein [Kangiellaceae bacterium]